MKRIDTIYPVACAALTATRNSNLTVATTTRNTLPSLTPSEQTERSAHVQNRMNLTITSAERQLLADLSEMLDDRTDLGDGDRKQRAFWEKASGLVSALSSRAVAGRKAGDAIRRDKARIATTEAKAPVVIGVVIEGGALTAVHASDSSAIVEVFDRDNYQMESLTARRAMEDTLAIIKDLPVVY